MAKTRCLSCLQMFEGETCPHCGYPASSRNDSHHLPVGTLLRGRYQLGQVLGQGGFGITYLALDTLMNTTVAVKEFFPSGTVFRDCSCSTLVNCVTADAVPHFEYSRERFLREARALVQFKDIPEIVDILDFVEENNTAYIVMEFVRGVDLAKYVQRHGGKLSVEETFRLLKPVIEALAAVHKGGIVHRDISPDNIVLDPMGGAKLLDFGAVRAVDNPELDKELEKSTEAIIKRGFAPVEQYNSRGSLGPWTDCYAMCATIWYCLTGSVPPEATARISEGAVTDWGTVPGLTARQRKALDKGFALLAKDRFPDMDRFLEALFAEAAEEIPEEISEKVPEKVTPKPRKKKLWVIPALCAAAAVLALFLAPKFAAPKAPTQEDLYAQAEQLELDGNYLEAALAFEELGYYNDSPQRALENRYAYAEALLAEGRVEEALAVYLELGYYSDSKEKALLCQNMLTYEKAHTLMDLGQYAEAAELFRSLGDYLDSPELAELCADTHTYLQAEELLEQGSYYEAATTFYSLGDFQDSRDRCFAAWRYITPYLNSFTPPVGVGDRHSVALKNDGTVLVAGPTESWHLHDTEGWQDITAIATGCYFTLGIREDGTVLGAGDNMSGRINVSHWTDIVAVCAGVWHSLGLKKDGTVVAIGAYSHDQLQVSGWRDIVAISAGTVHSVGLKSDGTVVYTGKMYSDPEGLASWRDIVAISAGSAFTLGLKEDGTVVFSGDEYAGIYTYEWEDIVAISAGGSYAVGLKADGTVVYTGPNLYGEGRVTEWTDIVALDAGDYHIIGLKADGTVVAVGENEYGQCDLSHWEDIRMPGQNP